MNPEELSYYRERARIERQHAADSTNPHAADIHEKLASLYEKLIELDEVPRKQLSVPVWTSSASATPA